MILSRVHEFVAWFPEGSLFAGKDWVQGWYYLSPSMQPIGPYLTEREALNCLCAVMEAELKDPKILAELTDEETSSGHQLTQKIRAAVASNCCDKGCNCE